MKKTILPAALSLFIALPTAAIDLEKPPEFKRSAEELERVQKQQATQIEADKHQIVKPSSEEAEYIFPDGHDPRDHDHDHDDAKDLDHAHDDSLAHQKQLEMLEQKGIKDESSWWPF